MNRKIPGPSGHDDWFKAWPLWLWWVWALAALLFVILLGISNASPSGSRLLTQSLCSTSSNSILDASKRAIGCELSAKMKSVIAHGASNGLWTQNDGLLDWSRYYTARMTVTNRALLR